jgi:hypothetical protein
MTNNDMRLDQQQQHDAHLTLQTLSPELIIEIMLFLPHSSLYLLQQTCQKFRQLSKRDTFKPFNLEFRDGPESYCISESGYQQRKAIRDILARRALCQECNAYRDSGNLQKVMQKLYELRYCHGCKTNHPELFFSPEEKEKQHTQCLGRIGNLHLCSHESFAGPDMVTLANVGGQARRFECDDLSHVLSRRFSDDGNIPSGFLCNSINWNGGPMKHSLRFNLSATLRLVVLNGCSNKDTKEAVRQLKNGSYTVSDTRALCKHFSSELLDECLASDSSQCSCFPRSEAGGKCGLFDTIPSATCKICRAEYHLSLKQSSTALGGSNQQTLIDLGITRNFRMENFLHPMWLFNLNYNQDKECDSRLKRNPLLGEEMKHVLWCDNPGCVTGSERRWERMALLYLNNAFNRGELRDGRYGDEGQARDMGWLSLEYDVFNGSTT